MEMTLDKDMIKEPRMWQLVMEPEASSLRVMAFSPIEHHALISVEIPYDKEISALKAFQEAVYSNPLLLADFRRVTLLLPRRRFMALPDLLDHESALKAFRTAFPEETEEGPCEILAEPLPGMKAQILTEIPAEFLGFLQRTFNTPRISHTLAPQALYFKGRQRGRARGKMFVNLRGTRCDVIVLGDAAPLALNSFEIHDPMDAVYYVMACREGLGISPMEEIILAGDPASRSAVAPCLRRFVRYVMPAIFPSVMFRAGRAALHTPFEMIAAPLVLGPSISQTPLS